MLVRLMYARGVANPYAPPASESAPIDVSGCLGRIGCAFVFLILLVIALFGLLVTCASIAPLLAPR
jgi:hypothetical protein